MGGQLAGKRALIGRPISKQSGLCAWTKTVGIMPVRVGVVGELYLGG